jgi:hypothetical protein
MCSSGCPWWLASSAASEAGNSVPHDVHRTIGTVAFVFAMTSGGGSGIYRSGRGIWRSSAGSPAASTRRARVVPVRDHRVRAGPARDILHGRLRPGSPGLRRGGRDEADQRRDGHVVGRPEGRGDRDPSQRQLLQRSPRVGAFAPRNSGRGSCPSPPPRRSRARRAAALRRRPPGNGVHRPSRGASRAMVRADAAELMDENPRRPPSTADP